MSTQQTFLGIFTAHKILQKSTCACRSMQTGLNGPLLQSILKVSNFKDKKLPLWNIPLLIATSTRASFSSRSRCNVYRNIVNFHHSEWSHLSNKQTKIKTDFKHHRKYGVKSQGKKRLLTPSRYVCTRLSTAGSVGKLSKIDTLTFWVGCCVLEPRCGLNAPAKSKSPRFSTMLSQGFWVQCASRMAMPTSGVALRLS